MNKKNRLVLIDGYSIFFRSFFATPTMTRSDGTPTNGVYGFIRMLLNIITDLNTTHIAIVFDSGKKTFRHDISPIYKANRPPVPENMIPQFPIIREVAKILNIVSLEQDGYEADDIIATLTKQAERKNFEVLIATCDKDLMQLVDDNVKIFDVSKKEIIDREGVLKKWGVYPEQLLDVLSLIGDSSDNVAGVPTIGEKTAVQLINQFGNIENLLNNIDSVKKKSQQEALKNNVETLKLSQKLITLCDTVNLPITVEDLFFKTFDIKAFRDFLIKMEFFSIIKQFNKYFSTENQLEFSNNNNKNSTFQYKKILNLQNLKEIFDRIIKQQMFIFDFITEQKNNYNNVISFTFLDMENKYIYQVDINNGGDNLFSTKSDNQFKLDDIVLEFKKILNNNSVKKITYDFKKIFRIVGDDKIENFDDISIMSYVFDAGKFLQSSLASLIKNYIQTNSLITINNIDNIIENEENYEKDKLNIGDIFNFSCERIECLYHIYKIIQPRLKDNDELLKLYNDIELPLTRVLAKMEKFGVKIAIQELHKLSNYFSEKIAQFEKEIIDLAGGYKFNIASPKQLGDMLFNKLGLPTGQKKSFSYSTNSEILEELNLQGYEIAGKVLEYRHFTKLKNTYTDILPKLIDNSSRVHTNFLNSYVMTGRLSSNNPNLQNIPIRTVDGEKIRKAFVAENGYSLIGVDYSQIELRILAEYANVKNMIDLFNSNVDIHSKTAKEIFGVEEITAEMRQQAKAINFSIVYGTSSFGLAKRLKISNSSAKMYIDNYFKLYPEILEYMNNIKEFVKQNGYTKTLFGRRCYVDLVNVKPAERAINERVVINAPIQGTGADIIKTAMIKVNEMLENDYNDDIARILLQIHDELLIEVKNGYEEEIKEKVKTIMENIVNYKVKFTVNCSCGKSWDEVH